MTDIIEAAARAVRTAAGGELNELDSLRLATAAIEVGTPLIEADTLERAAKEAEVYSRHENWEVMSIVRKIAAAIRALKEQP